MTIFRSKKNGLLYTIERVSPMKVLGQWYEAKPYKHSKSIGSKLTGVKLEDFEVVAVK